MKKKISLKILFILIIFLLSGCVSNDFKSSYMQFRESYILSTEFTHTDNDPLKTLKNMDLNLIENELTKMKENMDYMSKIASSSEEKHRLEDVQNYYKGLVYLLYAQKNFDNLNDKEKDKFYLEKLFIESNIKKMSEVK